MRGPDRLLDAAKEGARPEMGTARVRCQSELYRVGGRARWELRNAIRYDCEHYHVEVHRFWESRHPVELEAFRDQPLGEAYRFCEQDLKRHYRDYVQKMRRRIEREEEDGD